MCCVEPKGESILKTRGIDMAVVEWVQPYILGMSHTYVGLSQSKAQGKPYCKSKHM
jgi:hypothetical protein